ncbi:unnamed protein product [Mytilus edulis]|uniref:Uncharacterized protein n=1 Tax=Mytilus edulis TaxID=6550 RepID=A0A8S3VD91_MYTED|nr:unnamed protein product [Mytilus edulis]
MEQPTQSITNLVEGITNMMPKILEAKMVRHVRWQKHVVQKTIERLASKIAASKQTMEERDRQNKQAKLDKLEDKLNKVSLYVHFFFTGAINKINEKGKVIAKNIVKHLNSTKSNISSWKKSELPKNVTSPGNLQLAINLIRDRIENEIIMWSIENKDCINSEIEEMLRKEFMILEEDLYIQAGLFDPMRIVNHCVEI